MKTKKNIKSIILMAIICLSSVFFINISLASTTAKISVETARLREQPNTSSKILELASQGEEVEVIENNGEWCKVKYNKITGYLKTELLEIKNSSTKQENVAESENNTVVSSEEKETNQNNTVQNNTVQDNVVEEDNISEPENQVTEETTATPTKEQSQLGKYKTVDKVTLKIIPLINSLDVKDIEKDVQLEVTEILNNWAYVSITDGTNAWVRIEKLEKIEENNTDTTQNVNTGTETENKTETTTEVKQETSNNNESKNTTTNNTTKTMYINSQTVNLRESANTTSKIITQLSMNTEVKVISIENGWSYVEVNGKKGYISEDLLSTAKSTTSRSALNEREQNNTVNTNTTNTVNTNKNETNTTNTNTATSNNTTVSGNGNNVVNYAKQFLGNKYVYGGTTPSGFDCSGFTQYVYKHFGIILNRTAAAQYRNGTSVTNLQAGDLVMFGKYGINHVGIYMGGNTFIHAANSSRGVTTDTLASGYYKTNYVGARRIFN